MTDKFSKGEKNHKYKIDKKQSKDGIHMDYPVVFADNGGLYAHAFRYELLGDFSAIVLPDAHRGRNPGSKRGGKQGIR